MKKYVSIISVIFAVAGMLSAQSISEADFGKTKNGETAKLFTLKNAKGMTVKITNYGAIITSLTASDRNGNFADIVQGFDSVPEYEKLSDYFGAVVGRYGNRIGDAKFSLDSKTYKLAPNNNGNNLHGGNVGFDKKVWSSEASTTPTSATLKLSLLSPDGEEGFPGNLKVCVSYTLTNDNELIVNYKAVTDKPTVVNLTQHSYFNLYGAGNGNILNHELTIAADKFTPVDKNLITTGELRNVEGTPFDFRRPKNVGSRIETDDTQLKYGGGYDHNFVLNKPVNEMGFAARLYEPVNGRMLEVFTSEPGIQFYSGNFLMGQRGKNGKAYNYRYALCLETQHFPDSPNKKDFPSAVLRPGETYNTTTIFKFSAQ